MRWIELSPTTFRFRTNDFYFTISKKQLKKVAPDFLEVAWYLDCEELGISNWKLFPDYSPIDYVMSNALLTIEHILSRKVEEYQLLENQIFTFRTNELFGDRSE